MKYVVLIICLIGSILQGLAQDLKYRYAFKIGGEVTSYARKLITLSDGSFACILHPLPFGTDTCDLDHGAPEVIFNGLTQSGAVLAKYNADGTFAWMHDLATKKTINSFEEAFDLTADAADNIYVTGLFTDSLDFDPGPGSRVLRTRNSNNIEANQSVYVTKYSSDGVFIKAFDISGLGINNDAFLKPFIIRTGNDSTLFVCGQVLGNADFDPGTPIATTPSGKTTVGGTVFIASYDTSLAFRSVWFIGTKNTLTSGGGIEPIDMAISPLGEVYLTGLLGMGGDRDYDPGAADLRLSAKGVDDGLLLKFAANGDYLWGGVFGGVHFENDASDLPVAICLDEAGNIYLGGKSLSGFDADINSDDQINVPFQQGGDFIIKYNSEGKVIWVKNFTDCQGQGVNSGRMYDLHYQSGKLYACGSYTCTNDFDPSPTAKNIKAAIAGEDAYTFFCDTSGTLTGLTTFPGPGNENITAILTGPMDEVTLLGWLRGLTTSGGGSIIRASLDLDPGTAKNTLSNFSENTGSWFFARYTLLPKGIIPHLKERGNGFKVIRAYNGNLEILPEQPFVSSCILSVYDITGRLLKQERLSAHPAGQSFTVSQVPTGIVVVRLEGGSEGAALVLMPPDNY